MWRIQDWAGNLPFGERTFGSFDEGESFLCEFFEQQGWDYETYRGEYYIEPVEDAC